MIAFIVDDDAGIRWVLSRVLKEEGLEVFEAGTLQEAKSALDHTTPDLIFLDVYLPDGNGMKLLQSGIFEMPVILLTAESTFDHAAEAYRAGAMEYLPKPFDLDEVRQLIKRVQKPKPELPVHESVESVVPENKSLLLGRSPAMQQLFRTIGRVATSDLTVLITGESGTGKELVASELHERSFRHDAPFVPINTAAIPADLLESELFGYEKGAFTGADKMHRGRFEQADGGTLFLDEIGDMPAALQAKLLRVLEMGVVQRVGSSEDRKVNVRLLAATHQDLRKKMDAGLFREDLYYRLNVIPVHIPALRDRRDDIPELAEHLLNKSCNEMNLTPQILLDDSIELLQRYEWRGNVRELKNVMQRLAVLTPGATITVSDVALALGHGRSKNQDEVLPEAIRQCIQRYVDQSGYSTPTMVYRYLMKHVEPVLLEMVLQLCKGNQLKASEMLGLNRNTVRKLLKEYQLDANLFK
ncbi:MAG: sigma-54-dependent Fis family transcriptional regulator [Zetaproteobacteria bacterium]|nr:sigma-54-dependent Fis family transcriptional regulator [Zetaproteobacteria bacterium]